MKLHHDSEFVAWFKRPFRSQPHGGETTLDYAALCWSVTFNGMFGVEASRERFEKHLDKHMPHLVEAHQANPERFDEIFNYYGTTNLNNLDLPVMVNLLDGEHPELWQEGMPTAKPSMYQTGKPTLLDYLMRVSGCDKTRPCHTAIIRNWVEEHSLELANTLGQADSLFFDIPSKLLRDIGTKLKPVAEPA